MSVVLGLLLLLLGLICVILLFLWPINVAKKRQLEENIINVIIVLCITSLFLFGISWLVALIMAYVWPTQKPKWKPAVHRKGNLSAERTKKPAILIN